METAWPAHTADGVPYGTLDPTQCKEQFSLAFTHAITTAARCTVHDLKPDVERIDYTVRQVASHKRYTSSQVDVQMKCTSREDVVFDDGIHWPLDSDHYDHLRDEFSYNRKILVVLTVPQDLTEWVEHGDESLLLRKSAYWVNLEGSEPTDSARKTILIPKANAFNVDGLLGILQRVGAGEKP